MSFKLAILILFLILAIAYLLRCIINNINGSWICQKEDGTEVVQISQMGPFVKGICNRPDGKQIYSGRFNGSKLTLKRKDFGISYLVREGFPLEIAKQLEGTVMATMEFRLSKDKQSLVGTFHPQAIEFIQQPPKIKYRTTIKGVPRTWKRMGRNR